MIGIRLVILTQKLDAIHVFRHACRNMVVTIKSDRTVCDCLRPRTYDLTVDDVKKAKKRIRLAIWPTHDNTLGRETLLKLGEEPRTGSKATDEPHRLHA